MIAHASRSEQEPRKDLLSPWREYATSNRNIFLEEIRNFIRGAGNTREELSELRKAVRARRQVLLRSRRKQGRPRGSNRPLQVAVGTSAAPDRVSPDKDVPEWWDEHMEFRSVCMAYGDLPHLRPDYLQQILLFIGDAVKEELATIRKTVSDRAKSKGIGGITKKRGRPGVPDDEELMYTARIVAWSRHVEGKSWVEITRIMQARFPCRFVFRAGNEKADSWTAERVEDYLAAEIWRAISPS
jgi:hypothetical protein